jgi:hypothetical protein
MRTTRGTLTALAVALGLALAGCNNAGGLTTPAAPADPKAALAASTAELRKGNFTFASNGADQKAAGTVHLPSKSARMTSESTDPEAKGTFELRIVDTDYFMKMKVDLGKDAADLGDLGDLGELGNSPEMKKLADSLKAMQETFSGKYWSRLDSTKVDSPLMARLDPANPDITGMSMLLDNVVTVERKADGSYAGTVDATRGKGQPMWTDADLKKFADKLEAVPFTATLDGQGRLASVTLTVPALGQGSPAGTYTTEITGYGTATAVQKPPANETREASENTYEMLNK